MSLEASLHAAASTLRANADQVRDLAAVLGAGVAPTWEGDAAEVFRERCAQRVRALDELGDLIERAASVVSAAADDAQAAASRGERVGQP